MPVVLHAMILILQIFFSLVRVTDINIFAVLIPMGIFWTIVIVLSYKCIQKMRKGNIVYMYCIGMCQKQFVRPLVLLEAPNAMFLTHAYRKMGTNHRCLVRRFLRMNFACFEYPCVYVFEHKGIDPLSDQNLHFSTVDVTERVCDVLWLFLESRGENLCNLYNKGSSCIEIFY